MRTTMMTTRIIAQNGETVTRVTTTSHLKWGIHHSCGSNKMAANWLQPLQAGFPD
jgi:hypothetical protein